MKKIIILITILFFSAWGILSAETKEVTEVKQQFKDGLELLSSDQLSQSEKEDLINSFTEGLTKLWVLEHSSVKDGTFKLYVNSSDIFIDEQGNLYFKAESSGYVFIGTDEYNLKGPITLINKSEAYQKPPKEQGIIQVAARLGATLYTDLTSINYDILFIIQVLKINKINIGTAFGIRSLGIESAYDLTKNFNIGLYGGLGYPKESLKWRPIFGIVSSFKF